MLVTDGGRSKAVDLVSDVGGSDQLVGDGGRRKRDVKGAVIFFFEKRL